MALPTIDLRKRLLIASVMAAMIVAVIIISQLVWMPSPEAELRMPGGDQTPGELTDEARRTVYRIAVSLVTLLLLTLFLVAVYLLTRMGRSLKQTTVGGKPTEYVDAWSHYRLSEDAIERATQESDDDFDTPTDDQPPSLE